MKSLAVLLATLSLSGALLAANAALPTIKVNEDKIAGVTWYRDASTTKLSNVNAFYAYIGKSPGSKPYLRLKLQFASEKWLFVERAIIVADGHKYEIVGDWQRDHDSRIWEWIDLEVDTGQLAMLKTIATAKSVTIRFEGKQYKHDRNVPTTEIKAIGNILNAYAKLGGT